MSGLTKWAHPTWDFLHTFAAKINKDFFEQNTPQCLSLIVNICTCLPCKECTKHATNFMKGVNTKNIQTKKDLESMLFFFHNSVNQRTQKKKSPKTIIDTYKSRNFAEVTNLFIQVYSARYGSIAPGNISNLGKRRNIANNTIKWIKQHWKYFQ